MGSSTRPRISTSLRCAKSSKFKKAKLFCGSSSSQAPSVFSCAPNSGERT